MRSFYVFDQIETFAGIEFSSVKDGPGKIKIVLYESVWIPNFEWIHGKGTKKRKFAIPSDFPYQPRFAYLF